MAEFKCEVCGSLRHRTGVTHEAEPGRRFVRVAVAAEQLGIGPELLQGLIDGKQVEGFRSKGKTGNYVWFIYHDEIERLRAGMGG